MHLAHARHERLWSQIHPALSADDLSHDRDHLARVYAWALALAPEANVEPDLAGAAALVHDLVNLPKDAPDRARAGEYSAEAAVEALREAGYDSSEIEQITAAVRNSNWSASAEASSPLGAVLQDADRLDAMGAIGVFRTFACAQRMAGAGRRLRLAAPEDPLAREGRAPDDTRYALDHFAVKLLRLAASMHLPSSRAEAKRRHAVMRDFLEALARELEVTESRPATS